MPVWLGECVNRPISAFSKAGFSNAADLSLSFIFISNSFNVKFMIFFIVYLLWSSLTLKKQKLTDMD